MTRLPQMEFLHLLILLDIREFLEMCCLWPFSPNIQYFEDLKTTMVNPWTMFCPPLSCTNLPLTLVKVNLEGLLYMYNPLLISVLSLLLCSRTDCYDVDFQLEEQKYLLLVLIICVYISAIPISAEHSMTSPSGTLITVPAAKKGIFQLWNSQLLL